MRVVLFAGMKRGFSGRQGKNEPALTGIHGGKFENVAKKSAVAFRVLSVNDDVSPVDHGSSYSPSWIVQF
jgi:hypothetical protein